jgi:phosphoenolpyruvate---glycerone phosphotransferase subunit DhaK
MANGAFLHEDIDPALLSARGFARAHRRLAEISEEPLYLYSRQRAPRRRVGLVSGGGSGHEPLHAGFLGQGMLDAVAPGRVFASPHNRQVYAASRTAAGPDGVLHVVKNYTGDRINFGIAAERLADDGIEVRRVLVDDDLATDNADTATGRRGTAATVVVEKILGAAADDGWGLDALAELGSAVARASRSLAVASQAQTSLQTGRPAFELTDGDLEYGVGIHGERAAATIARPPYGDLLSRMCDQVLAALPVDDSEVALVVNGLGATTGIELYGIFETVSALLAGRGREVVSSCVGTLVPALDMRGFSLTVTAMQPEWVPWFARPVDVAASLFGGAR